MRPQAKDPFLIGGPGRDRTDDLFHAMEARSQLRHRPIPTGVLINSYARAVVSQTWLSKNKIPSVPDKAFANRHQSGGILRKL
jgi:hypothetical protein